MNVGIVIVAHAPMASALYAGGVHCFQSQPGILTYDVSPSDSPEASSNVILQRIEKADTGAGVLVLTDIVGASPANAAAMAAERARRNGHGVTLLAGANTPMLLRAITYRNLPLEDMADRVLAGGHQAILRIH
ncbi:MAG: PTS mannose transporter subunit IIA [Pigmentiphaga sp.]|nr:PTS mannose transporter subunit IIA [Pigmentiphaga sp.]